MKIYLVQHGAALAKESDPARPLSQAGRDDVSRVALFLKKAGIAVNKVHHSGKRRAEQTASILAEELQPSGEIEQIPGIAPNDDVEAFVSRLTDWSQDTLIVGHLPFMAKLVAMLLRTHDQQQTIAFLPGSVVCLERTDSGMWQLNYMLRSELLS